jgi:ribonuclease P protein component, eubacterial
VEDFFCTERWITNRDCVLRQLVPGQSLGDANDEGEFLSFPKTRRLTHRSEYERVKRNGITQRGKLLMLNAMPMENSGPWRAGFVTSGRVGGAVVRNRVRRRLREIVRRHQHELRQGVWFVIIARHEAATASYGALEDEWLRLARRASILL